MENNFEQLERKLNEVILQQQRLSEEISALKNELQYSKQQTEATPDTAPQELPRRPYEYASEEPPTNMMFPPELPKVEIQQQKQPGKQPEMKAKEKSNLEKFIGENLINKIGIIVTVIGVAIGVKYSIDNQLLSPLVRIILGYVVGVALLGLGIKLKKKYANYSAVLVSGSVAILYFITYAGYSFYGLIPQIPAFVCMLVFTVFSVFVSVHYNRQVIAHIGLVGAYAIPFLLNNSSGQTVVLFTYMAIINLGILFIAYKKYWKPLYFSSFGLTWVIFSSWYFLDYEKAEFAMTFSFLCVFFLVFYCMFLVYKLVQKESYSKVDIVPLLVNSFVFYGIGYLLIDGKTDGSLWLGAFTLLNALIHLAVSLIVYRQKLADRKLLYFTVALVITFVTITIPVWLNGNWVTFLWLAEAGLLFSIARLKQIDIHEKIAYPIMFLAFASLVQDWIRAYGRNAADFEPVVNVYFLTSVFAILVFAAICYFYFSRKYPSVAFKHSFYTGFFNFAIPLLLIVTLYFAFELEIAHYWNSLYTGADSVGAESYLSIAKFRHYKYIWILNYSLIFVSLLSVVNQLKLRNRRFAFYVIPLSLITVFLFLSVALYSLSELRVDYLSGRIASLNSILALRYLSFVFVGFALYMLYRYVWEPFMQPLSNALKVVLEYVIYVAVLWILSSELIQWLDISGYAETYKLGLSILWGIYALLMVAWGIWKHRKSMRIGGIVLFGITLMKVCFYDLSELSTISKTIIFISLGILLLIVSFLYNKYKSRIFDDE